MKRIYTIMTALSIGITAFAQEKETREIGGFTNITASGIVELVITQGETYWVEVEASVGKLGLVKTTLNGNNLDISTAGNWGSKDPIVYITTPILEELVASGATEIRTKGLIKGETFTLRSSGAAEIQMALKVTNLNLYSSGAADIELKGYAENAKIVGSGATNMEADELIIMNADISLSGASNTEINVSESVKGTTSGAANLDISGNPKSNTVTKSGISTVDRVEWNTTSDVEVSNDVVGDVIVQERGDTTRISVGNKKILIIDDWGNTKVDLDLKDTTDNEPWTYGIDGMILGVNGFLNSDHQMKVPATHEYLETDIARSINFQINAFDANINLYREYVTLHPGIGLEFNSYEFRKNYWMEQSSNNNTEISANPALLSDSSTLDFQKNRLKDTYLNVPLMLAFHTNADHTKAFHLGVGGYAGLRLASKMKYKYKIDGEGDKLKRKDDYYLSPFRYGLTGSVGYGKVNVFANYALNGLFEDGKGPELHPFSVGLMIIGF